MKEPRRPNRRTDWGQWANEVLDWLLAHRVQSSPSVKATTTTKGTFLEAKGGGGGPGESTSLQFKGQYNPAASYQQGDIVICETTDELDDGRQAGTYIASRDIEPGEMHPGIAPHKPSAEAVVESGEVIGINVIDPGAGYQTPPGVTITGDGTGATAHTTLDDDQLDEVIVDDGGADYTEAEVSFDDEPDLTNGWQDFALGRWQMLTLRAIDKDRSPQRIVFDAGREPGELPKIVLRKDLGNGTKGEVSINLADIPVGAGSKELAIREWAVCVDEENKYALFISSLPYDTPG